MVVGLATPKITRSCGAEVPDFMHLPFYRALHHSGDQKDASTTSADSSTVNYAAQFAAITSLAEAAALVSDALASKLGRALSMPVTDIDTSKTLPVYGVDSLLAIELRNWFAKEMKADLAIFDIMNAKSIVAVSETAVGRSQYKMDEWDD